MATYSATPKPLTVSASPPLAGSEFGKSVISDFLCVCFVFALSLSAVWTAVEIGLSKSAVLFTLPRPTCSAVTLWGLFFWTSHD